MIEDKPLTNLELEKVTSRRSRKDEEGRDFLCGCGKTLILHSTHISKPNMMGGSLKALKKQVSIL